jgi:hypothetical protein
MHHHLDGLFNPRLVWWIGALSPIVHLPINERPFNQRAIAA